MQHIQRETGIYFLTTSSLDGYIIEEYYGMVSGSVVYGANFVKDFFARVSDTFGGRAGGYEKALNAAAEDALREMAKQAREVGANAVLAVRIDSSNINQRMVMVQCYGTAIRYRPK